MAVSTLRIGVPVVGLKNADDETIHFMKPTTGGVRFSYSHTKTSQVEVEISFNLLGEAEKSSLVPGELYHLVITMPPDPYGFCEVRQAKRAKCGKIVTEVQENNASITKFSFTFPETEAETNGQWRDILIHGERPKSNTCNSGESPEALGS